MESKKRILIVEDDKSISELQSDYLTMSGYEVVCVYDGVSATRLIGSETFDLIILDLMIPQKDGFTVLREFADAKDIPVLVVSAKDDELDKIRALNLGADDYITKPFGMGELVARVNSHLKVYDKFKKRSETKVHSRLIKTGELAIDKDDRRVFIRDKEVTLTQKEFDLLIFLASNPNQVFSKDTLFERIWGFDALTDTSTVTVHIARIREKIQSSTSTAYIQTVWGAGYRFRT